jgi:hypothetical protein
MKNLIPTVLSRAGRYIGRGVNHQDQSFTGELLLAPALDGRGVALEFTALGLKGERYHQENTTIALTPMETVALWTLNTNVPSPIN